MFAQLRTLGLVEQGAVLADRVDVWLSDTAATAEGRQSRFEAFTPVWELVDARIRSDGTAIAACIALGAIIRAAGVTPHAFELGIRPVSDLINTPNVFSVIVAVLAGIVGILSLTESRASTLIGVFISVTTIPAAADIGLSISYASWSEARGSFLQLLLNVSILIVVGMIMLLVQKRIWDRVTPTAGSAPST